MDAREHNRRAWDEQVLRENVWTRPVTREQTEAARRGQWSVLLTETKPVPRSWFPEELWGVEVLCLASAGGQQGPILAAAGARVTVYDNSPRQLAQDELVARRDGLTLRTVEGDMRDLSTFSAGSFDLVFHPVSNLFVPEVLPVWREAFRVLRRGGVLLAGFMNPAFYIFDLDLVERAGRFEVRHRLPYSDLESLSEEQRASRLAAGEPLEFSHTLTELLGGQLDAGFLLAGLYEDAHQDFPLSRYMQTYLATRALKP
jgi:SAM-dependent methyltransferase